MVKVSIVVPVYNQEKYLKKSIDSMLNQSLNDIELIIVNDGSTDNSEEIINKYKDKRIKYYKHENHGIGYTRNFGIDKSIGEYIMFIDSDDYLPVNACEIFYNEATSSNCDIVISNYFEDCGYIKSINYPFFEESNIYNNPSILNKINLGPCNKIYKRSLLIDNEIKFEEHLKYEDAPFLVKAILKANRIKKIDNYLMYYVIHDKSETTIRDKKIFDIISICKIIKNELLRYSFLDNQMKELLIMILSDYIVQTRYINNYKIRKKFINQAFIFLNELDSKWKDNKFFDNFNIIEKKIKTNKICFNIYLIFYRIIKHNSNK